MTREAHRERYRRLRELGLCIKCGKSSYPFARCWKCRVKHASLMQKYRKVAA